MRGYQSIPGISIDAMENGAPTTEDCQDDDAVSSPSSIVSSVHAAQSYIPSYTSKIGYIVLGIIIGYIRPLLRWGPIVVDSSTSPHTLSAFTQQKSFIGSLPFEEVSPPSSWNPTLPLEHDPLKNNTHHHDTLKQHSTSPIVEQETSSLLLASTSFLGGGGIATSSSTTSGPHLLYHAHPSSFSLLYDNSKPNNNYLSEYSLDYFLINSGGFDAQINQAYCAVSTVATILNSLKYAKRFRDEGDPSNLSFDLPIDSHYDPYPYATQQDILKGDCVWNNVIEHGDNGGKRSSGNVDGIFKPPYGLGLEQAGKLLECHTSAEDWIVNVVNVDPSQMQLNKMRYDLKTALINPDARVMINYDRKMLGQVGGGHFSPLGAYHQQTDSFLILDVAKYKYPPVWVGADTLFSSMSTIDICGTWDYPAGQERLVDNTSDGSTNKLFNPITKEEYAESLKVLNCKQKMRGYIILKKKG